MRNLVRRQFSVSPYALLLAALLTLVAHPTLRGQVVTAPAAEATMPVDSSRSGVLFEELRRADSLLFDASFVSCNAAKANGIFSDDVEFYHDRAGFSSGAQVRETTKNLTRNCPRDRGITREVIAGSLRVYPIANYGAVQIGVHRFVERGAATSDVAQFVHLWHRTDGGWRLARVLSFDHRPTSPPQGK